MDIGKVVKRVSDYIDQKYIKKEGEEISNTNRNYCSALKMFLYHKEHVGYSHLKDISDDVILKYLLAIPGRSNRCTHHSAIKMMYRVHGFPNKMRYIPYPEKEDKLPVHVNKSEFIQMMSICKNNKHRAIISLMFDAGLRVSEVINLKIADIDESNMLLNIIQGKGRKDRKVKLTGVLLSILRAYMSEFNPIIYLFNGQSGSAQYSIKSCQEVVKHLSKKAGITKHFTPHKFRHGFAMTLLENRTTLDEIANQMGHHTTKTTEIYARINNKVIQNIESPLEQIMRENSHLINDTKKKLTISSEETTYKILFNRKTYFLKAQNNKIIDAPEGAKWSIGVESEKAIGWFEKKGATVER